MNALPIDELIIAFKPDVVIRTPLILALERYRQVRIRRYRLALPCNELEASLGYVKPCFKKVLNTNGYILSWRILILLKEKQKQFEFRTAGR